jgi:hypothetical protein
VIVGRCARPAIPFVLRTCVRCDLPEVDTELHFLLICLAILSVRSDPVFADLPFHDTCALMQFPDAGRVATFINRCCSMLPA